MGLEHFGSLLVVWTFGFFIGVLFASWMHSATADMLFAGVLGLIAALGCWGYERERIRKQRGGTRVTEQWDGRPENPERSGPHQITHLSDDWPVRGPWVLLWCAQERLWTDVFGNREPPEMMAQHRYLGPCLTPAEVEARVTAARREEIEAAIEIVERTISSWSIAASNECAAAIRALLKESEG